MNLRATRRPLCRPGLLLERLLAVRYPRREPFGRAVIISPRGAAFLEKLA